MLTNIKSVPPINPRLPPLIISQRHTHTTHTHTHAHAHIQRQTDRHTHTDL